MTLDVYRGRKTTIQQQQQQQQQIHFAYLRNEFNSKTFILFYMHIGYPEPTNATDNNKRGWNQQARIGCKYLSENNLPRIKLLRGKLFSDRYLLAMTSYWFQ